MDEPYGARQLPDEVIRLRQILAVADETDYQRAVVACAGHRSSVLAGLYVSYLSTREQLDLLLAGPEQLRQPLYDEDVRHTLIDGLGTAAAPIAGAAGLRLQDPHAQSFRVHVDHGADRVRGGVGGGGLVEVIRRQAHCLVPDLGRVSLRW